MSKTILITGTSTGFGHLMATTLSAEGHKVYASMRSPSGKNRDHAHTLEAAGISVIELDVTNNDSVQRAVNHVVEQAGKIDVLVNNAGIASAGVSEAFSDQQLKDLFDVNVFGVQRLSRAVLPAMLEVKAWSSISVQYLAGLHFLFSVCTVPVSMRLRR